MFENVRADLRASLRDREDGPWKRQPALKTLKAFGNLRVWPILAYRFGHWARSVRIPVVGQMLRVMAFVVRQFATTATGVFIHPAAEIGPGLLVHNGSGIVVGTTKIGKNCTLESGVMISSATRSVGDNVSFGTGAKVVCDPKIGNNVVVMPNSLVMIDVKDNTTVEGVPAHAIRSQRRALAAGNNSKTPHRAA